MLFSKNKRSHRKAALLNGFCRMPVARPARLKPPSFDYMPFPIQTAFPSGKLTVGPGISPGHAKSNSARGLYRRWGFAPRLKEQCLMRSSIHFFRCTVNSGGKYQASTTLLKSATCATSMSMDFSRPRRLPLIFSSLSMTMTSSKNLSMGRASSVSASMAPAKS